VHLTPLFFAHVINDFRPIAEQVLRAMNMRGDTDPGDGTNVAGSKFAAGVTMSLVGFSC
jgi:hypothetical protein